jgi:hypothetical protein
MQTYAIKQPEKTQNGARRRVSNFGLLFDKTVSKAPPGKRTMTPKNSQKQMLAPLERKSSTSVTALAEEKKLDPLQALYAEVNIQ